MRRREFIGLLGGAAAWPIAAHAQQKTGPTIGLLGCTLADESTRVLDSLRTGAAIINCPADEVIE